MMLYTYEDVCQGCAFARWHECGECFRREKRFCHCDVSHESEIDFVEGVCLYKKEKKDGTVAG